MPRSCRQLYAAALPLAQCCCRGRCSHVGPSTCSPTPGCLPRPRPSSTGRTTSEVRGAATQPTAAPGCQLSAAADSSCRCPARSQRINLACLRRPTRLQARAWCCSPGRTRRRWCSPASAPSSSLGSKCWCAGLGARPTSPCAAKEGLPASPADAPPHAARPCPARQRCQPSLLPHTSQPPAPMRRGPHAQPGVRNANIQVAHLSMNNDGIVFQGSAAPISNVYVSHISVAQARAQGGRGRVQERWPCRGALSSKECPAAIRHVRRNWPLEPQSLGGAQRPSQSAAPPPADEPEHGGVCLGRAGGAPCRRNRARQLCCVG